MSRSYKKTWVLKDSGHKGRRFAKRQAAKAVRRRQFEVQDGKHYRKFFNPYDIYDWMVGAWTAADRREWWVNRKVWSK